MTDNHIYVKRCCQPEQTWKKARTRGHCPQKFLKIVEISGLWKIDYSYFGIKLMNYEYFFLDIKYSAYLWPVNK